jgi:vancomycin resistance protein YoaR
MNGKRILSIISAAVIVLGCVLSGCQDGALPASQEGTTAPTEPTTTTTTTMRTTENLNTTFAESPTNKIYEALPIDESEYPYEISSFTTYYDSYNVTRTANIKQAVDHLNNVKIKPGKTFSFNQTVGKRTVTAGYEEAKVVNGKEFVDGLGGGICQVSSTIFQAALRANLKITVRACHSLEITYVKLGGDATVQWNSQDFQFKNDKDCDVKLRVSAENGVLTCKVYAKEDIRPKNLEINISQSGNSYTLTRTVDGEVNYTTYSKYSKPVTTTKKKDKDKDKDKKKKDKDKDKKKDKDKETTKKKDD